MAVKTAVVTHAVAHPVGKAAGKAIAKRVVHNAAHPGFKAVAARIAKQKGISIERASAILAARTRGASAAAKIANPHLLRVKG